MLAAMAAPSPKSSTRLLEVDPGEEEVEISGGAEAGGLDRGGQGGRLHGDVEPVEVGVAVVHRFGLDAGGEDPVADGMHPNVAAGHEGLELRRAMVQEREARKLVGAETADDG